MGQRNRLGMRLCVTLIALIALVVGLWLLTQGG
jgi:hypothetical protein